MPIKNKDKQKSFTAIPSELLAAKTFAYEPSQLIISNFMGESESKEYRACSFEMNNRRIKFRVGKITPTKVGQFVTLWKRIGMGPISPYDVEDPVDLFVISVRNRQYFGQFVFPKAILREKDVVSQEGKGGKRAMRLYPPWDTTDNRQAEKTQAWQTGYFFEISPNKCVDIVRVRKLFSG